MHRERIFKAAFVVAFFWVGVYIAFHPKDLLLDTSSWAIPALVCVGLLTGGAIAFANSLDTVNARLDRLRPQSHSGILPSIGRVPIHAKELPFVSTYAGPGGPPMPVGRAALKAGFALLKADESLIPLEIRRSDKYRDGIDLDLIEQTILGFDDASVAVFDKVLRVYLAHRDLLSTYEPNGHGRVNGVGGRTLLQHSLLVCQCAIELAEKFSFTGMYAVDEHGKPTVLVYPLRDSTPMTFKDDPVVALSAFAHDIGKIECYVREPGKADPVALLPNHDTIGARILGRMPELWLLPKREIRGVMEDDRTLLMTIVAFYHHPAEQPMDAAPEPVGARATQARRDNYAGIMVRSDRQVAIMELLIDADTQAGAIESDLASRQMAANNGAPIPDGDVPQASASSASKGAPAQGNSGPAPSVVPGYGQLTPEMVRRALWEAIELVLGQSGRINAPFSRGVVSGSSVGLMFHLPQWGGGTLILKEADFVNAVVESADLPEKWKQAQRIPETDADRGNAVAPASAAILRLFGERGVLLLPPGAPAHSPETSLWKVEFHKPTHIYPQGDLSAPPRPKPSGKPDFMWGSTIIIRPGSVFPDVQEIESYQRVVPHYIGERMGAAGRIRAGAKQKTGRRSVLDGDDAVTAMSQDAVAAAHEAAAMSDHSDDLEAAALMIEDGGIQQAEQTSSDDTQKEGASAKSAADSGDDGGLLSPLRVFEDQVEAALKGGQMPYTVSADGASIVLKQTLEQLCAEMSMRKQREQIEALANADPERRITIFLMTTSDGAPFHAVFVRRRWLLERGLGHLVDGPTKPSTPVVIGPAVKPPSPAGASQDAAKGAESGGSNNDQTAPRDVTPAEASPASAPNTPIGVESRAETKEGATDSGDMSLAWYARAESPPEPARRGGAGSRIAIWEKRDALRAFDIQRLENAVVGAMLDPERAHILRMVRLDDPNTREEIVICIEPLSTLLQKLGIAIDLPPPSLIVNNGFGVMPTKGQKDMVLRIMPAWFERQSLALPPRV